MGEKPQSRGRDSEVCLSSPPDLKAKPDASPSPPLTSSSILLQRPPPAPLVSMPAIGPDLVPLGSMWELGGGRKGAGVLGQICDGVGAED